MMQTKSSKKKMVPKVCPGCDLLITHSAPCEGHILTCPRCAYKLEEFKKNSIVKTFALSLTGLFLSIPALFLPLMTLRIVGKETTASIFDATIILFSSGYYFIGCITFITTLGLPLYMLAILFLVSCGLMTGNAYSFAPLLFRHYKHIKEWAMTDIFLVAILITVIKMAGSTEIVFHTGFYCFIGMVLCNAASQSTLHRQLFWYLLYTDHSGPHGGRTDTQYPDNNHPVVCHSCHFTVWHDSEEQSADNCPRCRGSLHHRKTNSVSRTWALLCTAIVLTIPANVLPIMEVEYFGVTEGSTILDGIIYFFQEGSYAIGLIILTASILVPVFKILGLIIILITIHFRLQKGLKRKMTMFRFIEFIGRWSMLDIFVIALLSALVQFGFLSTIKVAPAALYFTCVVLCTMFAAITFDTRLLWEHDK